MKQRGRPKLKADKRREVMKRIRMTKAESAEFEARAREAGISFSEYVRLLGRSPGSPA